MPPSETTPPRVRGQAARALALLAALSAGLALLACGSSKNAGDPLAGEQAKEHADEVKAQKFAKCLREHGVQASASRAAGGGLQLRFQGSPGSGPRGAEAAQNACAKYRPGEKRVNLSPQEKVKREEEILKFAKCMREHGIDIHTEVGGGKIAIGIHGSSSGPNPGSPAFQAAQKACSGDLPFKPKGGFAAPPPGAGGKEEGPGTKPSSHSEAVLGIGG
ncbi:MAG TPA: hypothetical protein VNV44_08435 [Solirubrobacteraceae bacterium]|jgi:hypothetical protein|nr:hypothetical protein [Solirubrobacteraceae bacterium]